MVNVHYVAFCHWVMKDHELLPVSAREVYHFDQTNK